MEEDDPRYFLKYDEQRIKSVELPELRKLFPLFDKEREEVSRHLEKQERESNRLKQTLAGLELKKSELEKLFDKRKHIYEKLGVRESKGQQELEKITVMYPIYQFQMNNFLAKSYELAEKVIDSNSNEIHAEPNLGENKRNLEEKVRDKQRVVDNFARKYLH